MRLQLWVNEGILWHRKGAGVNLGWNWLVLLSRSQVLLLQASTIGSVIRDHILGLVQSRGY